MSGGKPSGGPDALTSLTSLFIRRPVLTIVLNLLLVVAGLAAFQAVEVRELPNVDQPVVSVSVTLDGASPEAVDQQITSTVESAVARVAGIDSVSSRSSFGSSRVTIEFTDTTDINVAASDVRDAVGRVVFQLPEDADEPRVVKADADADAIMRLAVVAPGMRSDELTTLVQDVIVDRLSAVEGVADVQENGDREERIFIDVDPDRLATRSLTLADLSAALRNVALDVPAGSLVSPTQDLVVRANANVTTPEAFGAIAINDRTRLRDVATVRFGPEDATSIVRINGQTGFGLGIVRQAGSSTLSISEGVRAAVDEMNRTLPDAVSIRVTSDDAIFINGAIHEVELTLIFAVLIVVAVIYAFLLNLRATLIPAVTMPVSLIAVIAAIYLAGFSINILTLLALVLATGLVVDDAIIVLENIVRRRDMGAKPQAAAVIGTREVFFAVIATTATLAAVFVPISFLPGQAGALFAEFGFVLAIAVLLSSFVALTLCPMLASRLLKEKPSAAERHSLLARGWIWMGGRLAGLYGAALRFSLTFPLVVLGLASMFAFSAFVAYNNLAQELTPPEDRGTIFLRVTTPQSAALDYTSSKVRQVEDLLLPYVQSGEAANVYSISGAGGSNNSAFVFLSLADWAERERPQSAIAAEINRAVAEIPGVRAFAIQPNSLGIRGGGRGLQFAVLGSSYAAIADAAETLREAMETDGRWGRVDLNFEATQPQLSVQIDRERASDLGIDIEGLATAVQALLDGTQVTTTFIEDQAVPIEIVSTGQPINDPADLSNLFLKTGDGRIVPMSSVATLTEEPIAPSLTREERSRAVSLSAELKPGYTIGQGWTDLQAFASEHLPPEMRLIPLAEAKTLGETSGGLALTFGFAIVIVLLVLAAQFESFVSALIIIATVPFGLACAVFALQFFGQSLNLYSQIGLVLLVGIIAKNGILVVEFANAERDRGLSVREAVEVAAMTRLRPVMMTMIATIVGGVPLIFSTGAGAEARQALGYVIVGGLALATLATLFITPIAYLFLARFSKPQAESRARLDHELEEAARLGADAEGHGPAKGGLQPAE
ncbi:efflux RND transporter permease subunit [Antarcticirhabdus aurantiaca]|uniref:Efflux RND transporter permease subunit n=1 Tax=Antarcticirhabdus aurantiaca TaxID=2606717 RepID=A0ACD4NSW5_9HYPH|nr:efflux RND transporter permease subunit [Antarcticirhabdus aurantiaca]WAJ29999.1 efflux RND transporter permease subunit [Jeongeuplla avenae]